MLFRTLIDLSRIRLSDYEQWFQVEAGVDKNSVNKWISMQIVHPSLDLTFSLPNSLKKCRFLPLNQCFGCNDSKLMLILMKKWFPTEMVDFPKDYVQECTIF